MNKRTLAIGLILVLLGGSAVLFLLVPKPPEPLLPRSQSFVIPNLTVVHPGESSDAGVTVAVADGRFVDSEQPDMDLLEELADGFIMPGFVDMHAHLPPETPLRLGEYFLLLNLAHGVTALRGAGDTDGTAIPSLRAQLDADEIAGPRLFTSGYFVAAGEARWTNTVLVESPDDADAIVQRIADEGHRFIKAYENLTPEMIEALVVAAEARGMGVLGHVPFQLSLEEAKLPDTQHLLGVVPPKNLSEDSILARISEWDSVDDARMEAVAEFCKVNDLANTPTLALTSQILRYKTYPAAADDQDVRLLPPFYGEIVWHPEDGLPLYRGLNEAHYAQLEDALQKKRQMVKRLHDVGARLYLGTDTQQPFVVPGAGLHAEIDAFLDAGVPLDSTIAYATVAAYRALPGNDELGRVEPGYLADAVIFREDPTASPDALNTITAVIADGKLYLKSEMDERIAEWQQFYQSGPVDFISRRVARNALAASVAEQ